MVFKFKYVVSDNKKEVKLDIDDFHFYCSGVMVLDRLENDTLYTDRHTQNVSSQTSLKAPYIRINSTMVALKILKFDSLFLVYLLN